MPYAFLSKPPQKTRPAPTIPLPSPPATKTTATPPLRHRSSTLTAIAAWAQAVQPGSPAPLSPHRRRRSISRRRPSISSHSKSSSSGIGSFLTISTPTSASRSLFTTKSFVDENPKTAAEPAFDLTELGYAAMFVNLPYTPATPAQFASQEPPPAYSNIAVPPIPSSPVKPKGLKRFRSLTMLKPTRGNKAPSPASPTRSTASKDPKAAKKSKKEPKAKASHPPTLQNELLLMQFMSGGSIDTHIKTTMTRRAKEQAPAKSFQPKTAALEGVWRDESGTIWMDEEEKVERAALLTPMDNWMSFERRGSETLTISGCSDLFSGQGRVDVSRDEDAALFGTGMTLRIPFQPPSSAATEKEKKIRKIPPPLNLTPPPRTGFVFEDSFAPVAMRA